MPLINPVQSNPKDLTEEWMNKLMGKTISDSESSATAFSKKDLPEGHRVVGPNTRTTRDINPDRLTVHTDEQGIVTNVGFN
ncbi:uncharacterized protein J7T54_007169 [Emericellopsis cladophorae]|uniref:Proteinase inhibitor I78 n=1 Tax=Emericellopsis cladophorae TaxID=2686198 RepID=A0A9Q0BHU8_9HYPO|nr:uncharacterized protein J7T54_007169 [Emericellopsis cladophorae]KAI6785526.1 hypothetical protein J7T54_007169 [Emericellopsis cladophorae]